MARIMIIGGHGRVALLAAPLLVEAGHEVTSVIRNPDHEAEVAAMGATPHVADVQHLDTAAFTDLLVGQDVLVWSAGAGGGNPERTYAVDRDAAITSIEAATIAGVGRYVMVSYAGAGADHGVEPDNSFFAYAEAKAAADQALRASRLDWTILGPSRLTTDNPTGMVEVLDADGAPGSGQVSRGNVAQMIAAVVTEPAAIGRTIDFNDGQTPVSQSVNPQGIAS